MGKLSARHFGLRALVADTQSAVWLLTDRARLSSRALEALHETIRSRGSIIVSAVSLIEVTYGVERGRLPAEVLSRLRRRCTAPAGVLRLAPVDYAVTLALERVPRDQVPDMPDRIIGATALALDIKLVTSDRDLRESVVPTIW